MNEKEVVSSTDRYDEEFHYVTYVDFSLGHLKIKVGELTSIGYEVIGNGIFSEGENCGYYKVELKKRLKTTKDIEKKSSKKKLMCLSDFDADNWQYPVAIICFVAGMLFAYWLLNL